MSDKAVVLINYNIVKLKGFKNPIFSIDGRLSGFESDNDDSYIYCEEINLKNLGKDDLDVLSSGYYNENLYLQFKKSNDYSDFVKLFSSAFDSFFEKAANGDKIFVSKLQILTPYNNTNNLKKFIDYELNYNVNDNYFNPDKSIINPPNTSSIVERSITLNINAINFYFANIVSANNTFSKALIITKISLRINNIISKIFPIFNELIFNNFKESQLGFWNTSIFKINEDENKLNSYLSGLREFYKIAYDNQLKYVDEKEDFKLISFSLLLSSKALTVVTVKNKIKLLNILLKENLSETFPKQESEYLVVKIVNSFLYSPNIIEIDDFLTELISDKPQIENKVTLYEFLYNSMTTSFKFVEGIIGLSNEIFNTKYEPINTKAQFVNGVYKLWQLSKYNPFDNTGSYKPNTIGLYSEYPNLSQINSSVNIDDYLYKYTNYYASDPVFKYFTVQGIEVTELVEYKNSRPKAAPIIMPYKNEKLSSLLGETFILDTYVKNFEFDFSDEYIIASQKTSVWRKYKDISTPNPNDYRYETNLAAGLKETIYGKYKIFQPVTLVNIDFDSKKYFSFSNSENIAENAAKLNSLVPLFVLKFINDNADRSNIEDIIGFFVDAVSTVSGYGSLQKLKHLRWAATGAAEVGLFTIEGVRLVVGGVEFTSGFLSFLANFVQCSTNDKICNGVKEFLNFLQLGCLAFNFVDGLGTIVARAKAKKLIQDANELGSNSNTSLQNLTNALGNTQDAENAAFIILEFADQVSNAERINKIADRVKLLLNKKIDINPFGLFNKDYYSIQDIREIVEHLSTKVNTVDIPSIFDKLCKDFIFTASRTEKLISKDQLIKRINFYYEVVLKRGFTSGFNDLVQYKRFCTKVRDFFTTDFKFWNDDMLDNIANKYPALADRIDRFWIDGKFNFKERVELVVQGSANTKHRIGEPQGNLTNAELPEGTPGDFEFALIFDTTDFEILGELLKRTNSAFDKAKFNKKGFLILSAKDKIAIKDILGKEFVKNFQNSFNSSDINFVDKDKIKFAFVKKRGDYDTEPFTKFKYN